MVRKTKPIFAFGSKGHGNILKWLGEHRWLISYYYVLKSKPKHMPMLDHIKSFGWRGDTAKGDMNILDSGAYSAGMQGTPIFIWNLIEFIEKYHEYFYPRFALDVIGSPLFSEVNFRIMQEALPGIEITPIYHSGEPYYHLQSYVDRGCPYIGIAPVSAMSADWSVESFLIKIWNDIPGLHDVKTHGFGYLDMTNLHKFTFTSADATTWVMAAAYGRLTMPPHLGGQTITSSTHEKRVNDKNDLSYILKHGNAALYREYIYNVINFYNVRVGYNSRGKVEMDAAKVIDSRPMTEDDLKDNATRALFNAASLAYWFDTDYSEHAWASGSDGTDYTPSLFDDDEDDQFFYRLEPERIEPVLKEAKRMGKNYTGYPSCMASFLTHNGWGDELEYRKRMRDQWAGL